MIVIPLKTSSGLNAREQFSYDPNTGDVIRFSTGRPVGTLHSSGYLFVRFEKRTVRLHRLVWAIVHGKWPDGEIDHINGNRADNRLCNLRDIPRAANRQNLRSAKRGNSTGRLGVTYDKTRGRFVAQIVADGKHHHLGRFCTAEEAHSAYLTAKRRLHPVCTI